MGGRSSNRLISPFFLTKIIALYLALVLFCLSVEVYLIT